MTSTSPKAAEALIADERDMWKRKAARHFTGKMDARGEREVLRMSDEYASTRALLDDIVNDGYVHIDHAWRCDHPEIYGPCDCEEVAVRALHGALAEVKRQERETAWAEGYGVGYDDQRYRDTTMPYPLNPYRRGEDA